MPSTEGPAPRRYRAGRLVGGALVMGAVVLDIVADNRARASAAQPAER